MAHELARYTVAPTDSIRAAMVKITENKHRAVVVVDADGTVLGTVSDGDIRRAFLHDVMDISPVSRVMQLNPRVLPERERDRADEVLRREHVTLLPVVSDENRLVDVVLAYEP